jgi:hypothetical protein
VAQYQRWFQHYDIHVKNQTRKRRRDNKDEAVVTAAILQLGHGSKRFWVDARSSYWIGRALDVTLLRGDEFAKTFRMNCNSFRTLHSILGMVHRRSSFSLLTFQQNLISQSKTHVGD